MLGRERTRNTVYYGCIGNIGKDNDDAFCHPFLTLDGRKRHNCGMIGRFCSHSGNLVSCGRTTTVLGGYCHWICSVVVDGIQVEGEEGRGEGGRPRILVPSG